MNDESAISSHILVTNLWQLHSKVHSVSSKSIDRWLQHRSNTCAKLFRTDLGRFCGSISPSGRHKPNGILSIVLQICGRATAKVTQFQAKALIGDFKMHQIYIPNSQNRPSTIDVRQITISGQGYWWLVRAFWKKIGRLKEFFAVPDGFKWFSVLYWSCLSMFESCMPPKERLSRNQSYLSDAFSQNWTHFAFRTEYRRFIALSVSLSFRNRVEEVKNDLGCTVNHWKRLRALSGLSAPNLSATAPDPT